jgi:DNA invertase Pin-like site-specific DNA recombinase
VLVDGYIQLAPGAAGAVASVQRWQVTTWTASRGWRISRVFEEVGAEPPIARPLLQAALARVRSRESDGIVVVTLLHLGDSLEEALSAIEHIEAAGGMFASVWDGIDISTSSGRGIVALLVAIAEWRRP